MAPSWGGNLSKVKYGDCLLVYGRSIRTITKRGVVSGGWFLGTTATPVQEGRVGGAGALTTGRQTSVARAD